MKTFNLALSLLVFAVAGCDIVIPPIDEGGQDSGQEGSEEGFEESTSSTGGGEPGCGEEVGGEVGGGETSGDGFECFLELSCGDASFSVNCSSRTECTCSSSDASEGGSGVVFLDEPVDSCSNDLLVEVCGFDIPGSGEGTTTFGGGEGTSTTTYGGEDTTTYGGGEGTSTTTYGGSDTAVGDSDTDVGESTGG